MKSKFDPAPFPVLLARWDEGGIWRCPQCGEPIAFKGENIQGKAVLKTTKYRFSLHFQIWRHSKTGWAPGTNSRELRELKREIKRKREAEGRDEDEIAFEIECLTKQAHSQQALNTKTPNTMEDVTQFPAMFECLQCSRRVKISNAGN